MDKRYKTLIIIAVIAYVISPDFFAGPVDDIIAIVLGYLGTTHMGQNSSNG